MRRWHGVAFGIVVPIVAMPMLSAFGSGLQTPLPEVSQSDPRHDLVIRNGLVYDGSGAAARRLDVAVRDDRVASLLMPGGAADAAQEIDVHGQAVAPGFINVLSWATEPLIVDGCGMSDASAVNACAAVRIRVPALTDRRATDEPACEPACEPA